MHCLSSMGHSYSLFHLSNKYLFGPSDWLELWKVLEKYQADKLEQAQVWYLSQEQVDTEIFKFFFSSLNCFKS